MTQMGNVLHGIVVEEQTDLTLADLCRACGASEPELTMWVLEGVLEPQAGSGAGWRFGGTSLRRARRATSLARDLDINAAGVALVLDLLDEVETLRSRLASLGEE